MNKKYGNLTQKNLKRKTHPCLAAFRPAMTAYTVCVVPRTGTVAFPSGTVPYGTLHDFVVFRISVGLNLGCRLFGDCDDVF